MIAGKILQALLWLAYPLAIFFGLQFLEPWAVALLLVLALLARRSRDAGRFLKGLSRAEIAVFVCMLCLAAATALTNSETLLKLYPAAMNLGMLLIFGLSLLNPPSMVERFARLREPDLPPAGIAYTRCVTQFWCGFFVLNGALATFTALYTSRETWALYNGLIVYLLMGSIFAGEWLIRRYVIKRNA